MWRVIFEYLTIVFMSAALVFVFVGSRLKPVDTLLIVVGCLFLAGGCALVVKRVRG